MNESTYPEITESVHRLLDSIPGGVTVAAAAKTRTAAEVDAAIAAGITIVGHNYVQEAEQMKPLVRNEARWHLIGHLQRNKINKALPIFDMIETLDTLKLAEALDLRCEREGIVIPVLIEINSGEEFSKTGVHPDAVDELVESLAHLAHIRVEGLMTMGPFSGDPEDARPYFRQTREAFERLKSLDQPNVEMKTLSMGMSNSYRVAIEEGATLIRIGTALFGPRPCAIG
jgi:pyridoxal phosphate enzyme (YggS family)